MRPTTARIIITFTVLTAVALGVGIVNSSLSWEFHRWPVYYRAALSGVVVPAPSRPPCQMPGVRGEDAVPLHAAAKRSGGRSEGERGVRVCVRGVRGGTALGR